MEKAPEYELSEYELSYLAHSVAYCKYELVAEKYRAKVVGDDEYIAARKEYEAATKVYDAAHAKAAGWTN